MAKVAIQRHLEKYHLYPNFTLYSPCAKLGKRTEFANFHAFAFPKTVLTKAPIPDTSRGMDYLTPLDAPALRDLGIPAPWSFGLADRVRFGELDAMGHVNNTASLRWFESFRLPFLKARGATEYLETSPRLVLKQVGVEYHAEILNSESYVITGRVRSYRRTSFMMEYAVWVLRDTPVEAVTSHALIVFLNPDGTGRFPIPEAAKQAFAREDGAAAE